MGDSLYINGEKQKDVIQTPTASDLLNLKASERKEIVQVTFSQASASEGGSQFTVRAARAESIQKCRQLYQAIMLDPANMCANHNSAIYRLYTPEGAKTTDGYVDDGEFGMGRVIRNYLQELDAKNMCVFITQHYGGHNTGPKGFSIVKDLVKQVVEMIK